LQYYDIDFKLTNFYFLSCKNKDNLCHNPRYRHLR